MGNAFARGTTASDLTGLLPIIRRVRRPLVSPEPPRPLVRSAELPPVPLVAEGPEALPKPSKSHATATKAAPRVPRA